MSEQSHLKSVAQQRERHNPLRGLTMAYAVSARDAAYRGDHSEIQWLYHRMMRSSAVIEALRLRREAAIKRLDWGIDCVSNLPSGCARSDAEAQQGALRAAYERIDNLTGAFSFLSLASFHGFAHMQKLRDDAGSVVHLEPLDQWNWIRDGYKGEWFWNASANPTTADRLRHVPGAVIEPGEFIILESEIPILEVALGLFIKDLMAGKDWSHWLDIYGIPSAFIVGPEGVAPGSSQEAAYRAAAEEATAGGGGYLPHGSQMYFADAPRQSNPFKEYADDIRAQIILAGTGGKLTMLAEPGSGTLAGSAHQDAFDQIADAEAAGISECFQKGIDGEILSSQFPGWPQLAYFRLCRKTEADPNAQADIILRLSQAGYRADAAQVSERTGFKVMNFKE